MGRWGDGAMEGGGREHDPLGQGTGRVEERFSLTDQVRRASRSVAANISEAWRKRRYPAAFVSKLSDAEGEAAETQTWIEMARRCGYWPDELAAELDDRCEKVIAQLVKMIDHPEPWCRTRAGRQQRNASR
jgi:four helix bundle protein